MKRDDEFLFRKWQADPCTRASLHEYLNSIAPRLPEGVRGFALAGWRYDLEDNRCPCDSLLESAVFEENDSSFTNEAPNISLTLTLRGAFKDGRLVLVYEGVSEYHLRKVQFPREDFHGDWLGDEIQLQTNGRVLHVIEFESGLWKILFQDMKWYWRPDSTYVPRPSATD